MYVLTLCVSESAVLSREQHAALFLHIEEMLSLSMELALALDADIPGKPGRIFAHRIEAIAHTYEPYLMKHAASLELIYALRKRRKWRTFEGMSKQICGYDLPALLIQPFQRITRYKLLFEELTSNTADAAEIESLRASLQAVTALVGRVNQAKRVEDHAAKVLSVQKSLIGKRVPVI
jgi:hypothetical protein